MDKNKQDQTSDKLRMASKVSMEIFKLLVAFVGSGLLIALVISSLKPKSDEPKPQVQITQDNEPTETEEEVSEELSEDKQRIKELEEEVALLKYQLNNKLADLELEVTADELDLKDFTFEEESLLTMTADNYSSTDALMLRREIVPTIEEHLNKIVDTVDYLGEVVVSEDLQDMNNSFLPAEFGMYRVTFVVDYKYLETLDSAGYRNLAEKVEKHRLVGAE